MKRLAFFLFIALSLNLQADALFEKWDANKDGFLTREEVPEGPRAIFDRKDKDGDGKVSLEEHTGRTAAPMPGRDRPERPDRRDGPSAPEGSEIITIRQTWHQEPDGFDRLAYVRRPLEKTAKPPVLIVFHGNGGNGAGILRGWQRDLPRHLVVAPDGYARSWNIYGEKSQADDVGYLRALIAEISERYPDADMEDVTLLGTSNGGGILYRFLIEIDEPLFHRAVPLVSSLLEHQFRDGEFWMPKKGEVEYTEKKEPEIRPEILYVHGTEDGTVPFEGGYRGKELHLSALATAHAWASRFGYEGAQLEDGDAEEISEGLLYFDYEGSGVRFVKAVGGNHGLAPHQRAVRALVAKFIEGE